MTQVCTIIAAIFLIHAAPAQQFMETLSAIQNTFWVNIPDCHVADMDGDGNLDIVFFGSTPAYLPLHIAWGDGRGNFKTQAILGAGGYRSGQLTIGDVDNDGDLDILASEITRHNYLVINQGQRKFVDESQQRLPTLLFADLRGVSWGDLDGDGDLDIVGGYYTRAVVGRGSHGFVWENDGTGHFTDQSLKWGVTSIAIGYTHSAARLVFGDFDHDGDLDVISRGSDLKLLINHGNRLVDESAIRLSIPATGSGGAVNLEDTDQDGDLDLLIGPGSVMGRMYYYNDGKGFFTEAPSTDIPMFYPAYWPLIPATSIHFFDIDGDGDRDMLAPHSHWSVHPHDIYLSDGKGKFSFPPVPFLPLKNGYFGNLIPADFDGDGDVDLLRTLGPGPRWLMSNTERQIAGPVPPQIGSNYKLDVYGDPGLLATVFVGIQPAELHMHPYGRFGLDPRSAVMLTAVKLLPSSRMSSFTVPVPNNTALKGLIIYCQSALIDTAQVFNSRFTNVMQTTVQ